MTNHSFLFILESLPITAGGGEEMTMKHIKIFIAVCDTGSMTAAAKKLFIAQPAVSFAIAEMEDHYGQKLFDRISNRLHIESRSFAA